MKIDEAFKKYIKVRKTEAGYSVKCSKGLWGVEAPTKERALNEAKHYFRQYFYDGEYL